MTSCVLCNRTKQTQMNAILRIHMNVLTHLSKYLLNEWNENAVSAAR